MDKVCAKVDLSGMRLTALNSNGTLLASGTLTDSSFQGLPTYDLTNVPAVSYTIGSTNYSAKLFSVLGYITDSVNRYALPTGQTYWNAARNTTLNTDALINTFTSTTVPTKNYYIITPNNEKLSALTGNIQDQKSAVSYDFLYSLQYEFCFWAKIYRTLVGDYIRASKGSAPQGLLRQIVNAMNSVNLRLTDLTKIAQAVSDSQREDVKSMNDKVNQFLTSISSNVTALEQNRKDLLSSDVGSRMKARMLEYSEEKNAYANQMLSLYGFANLIALGLLFYIYRS